MPELDDLVAGAVALAVGELVGRIRMQKVSISSTDLAWEAARTSNIITMVRIQRLSSDAVPRQMRSFGAICVNMLISASRMVCLTVRSVYY